MSIGENGQASYSCDLCTTVRGYADWKTSRQYTARHITTRDHLDSIESMRLSEERKKRQDLAARLKRKEEGVWKRRCVGSSDVEVRVENRSGLSKKNLCAGSRKRTTLTSSRLERRWCVARGGTRPGLTTGMGAGEGRGGCVQVA